MSLPFLQQALLTCIGNKRKLVQSILIVVKEVAVRLGKERLRLVDGCTGSGVVARHLLPLAEVLYVNDLEYYSYVMARSVFTQPSEEQRVELEQHFRNMQILACDGPYVQGLVASTYAPTDTHNVRKEERCFYTRENALIIDTLRSYITSKVPVPLQHWCLAPLLVKASINVNTAGMFKSFYKSGGIGCFGGKGKDALGRITKPITIEMPVWSEERVGVHCSQEDIITLLVTLPDNLDLIYADVPYDQHSYGSNYHLLNTIAVGEITAPVSKVSGIPCNWQRSAFNYHVSALTSMEALLALGLQKAHYVLISYSTEGIITPSEWKVLLSPYSYECKETPYETFKACRNRGNRSNEVTELLYLVSLKKN